MRQRDEGRGIVGFRGALARAGYALAGAIAAMLAGWIVLFAFPQPRLGMLAYFVGAAAMAVVLMLWASFKPPCCKGGSTALQALLVLGAVVGAWAISDCLNSPSMTEHFRNPLIWIWTYVFYLFNGSYGFILPAAWALGCSEQWPRRPWGWAVGELAFALVMGALIAGDALGSLGTSLPTFVLYQILFTAGALAAAGVVQRLACELAQRIRAGRPPA